ncbi:MAG: NifU protein [Pseudomonadota bacterium]|jgi:Fe-S cluster biogenesis protein NfuA
MSGEYTSVEQVLEAVLEPLVRQDGGELFVVQHDDLVLALHLRGKFSGCPGNTLAIRRVIEPAIRAVAPRLRVIVSAGELLPGSARPCRQSSP